MIVLEMSIYSNTTTLIILEERERASVIISLRLTRDGQSRHGSRGLTAASFASDRIVTPKTPERAKPWTAICLKVFGAFRPFEEPFTLMIGASGSGTNSSRANVYDTWCSNRKFFSSSAVSPREAEAWKAWYSRERESARVTHGIQPCKLLTSIFG